ncbi:rap guanine nucleotide exchange factor 1b isoform X5 [Pangasianodon hypophthalmus]|uniref:rap guanine nucleotide exchange factor 1b isoform X5 n=1 Tax=Pangasianodon hypophthalmus TaxID=310915 RepID=UPI000F009D83|nr:rap guanine nucleotide exchange factor 1b isoform X5 [Pangasianodon hypophthalmus]
MGNTGGRNQTSSTEADLIWLAKQEKNADSQRSHISTFTMKLMDKFHSPKIKRTPSKKGKQSAPEPAIKSTEKPVNKKVSRLEEQEKEVVSALRYFKTIVDKMSVDTKVLQMLPGSASKVLEAILPLMQVEARIQHSSAVSSCHNRVYQSLANLIRWADQVMLEGIDLDDKETVATVTAVIKAVLDGVKELVKLTIEKHEQPSPTSPSKPAPPVAKAESVCEMPLTEREKEILSKTTPPDSLTNILEEEVAPPKPPLPGLKLAEHSPPALPPKKRQSASSPTRIAVVAPMSRTNCGLNLQHGALKQQQEYEVELLQRRFSGGSQSYGGDSPRLSPCSIMGKLSKSDEQLSSLERDSGQCSRNTSCETLDNTDGYDPDYDFLHQDLSVSEPLPFPTVPSSCLSPLPECLSETPVTSPGPAQPRFSAPVAPISSAGASNGERPPALPQKKRRSAPILSSCQLYEFRPSDEDTPTSLFTPTLTNGTELSSPSDSPPPLPEKKCRTILQYMQFVEDYSEPQPSVFYQTPQSERIYEQRRNKRFQEVYGSNDSYETPPPPALPPKQRQLSESANDEGVEGEGEYVNLYSTSQANGDSTHHSDPITHCDVIHDSTAHIPPPKEGSKAALTKERLKSADSSHVKEEVDELSLVDHKEIMSRITLKSEGDDGPDVRAGSSDILLVHATETDRKDLVLYCEAFLTTYRTFITPEDLIKKLHYRYTHFCHSPDTFKKRVSKNTFFVLVRVVDELCVVELTEDILRQLMDLVFRLVCNGELSLARVLRKNILDKVEQKRMLQHTHILQPLAARGVSARPGTLHDFRSHEIADQLTLLDAELFYKIEIPEVLLWAKEQNEEKSPNLTQFTEHFNNMSYWVRSIIIQQEKAQDREKLLLKFIKIMKHLRKLNNFNSYLAILSALDSAPIRRLEWQKQTSEGLEEYCTLIDSSSSFRAYRAALADVEPPCIPYLGLILQDLTFVHLGNPDLIDGKVNFSKRWQQFNILDSMRRFQQVHYELKRNDDIVAFFNDFSDHLAEEALWELSLKIKPRNITRRRTERDEKT